MNPIKRDLKTAVQALASWMISFSLALAPFNGVHARPAEGATLNEKPAVEIEQGPFLTTIVVDMTEWELSQKLLDESVALLDRAYNPNVMRLSTQKTGLPTANEILDFKAKLSLIRQKYQTGLAQRVAATQDVLSEQLLVEELNAYFEAVEKFEFMNIVMGQPTDPTLWQKNYGLSIELDPMGQLVFLGIASLSSPNYVKLETSPVPAEILENLMQLATSMNTTVDKTSDGKWTVNFNLNSGFVTQAESLAMTATPSTRNVLRYALHFSVNRLYSSMAIDFRLLRTPMNQLPEPSKTLSDEFPSLKLAKADIIARERRRVFAESKPAILSVIQNSLEAKYKTGYAYLIDGNLVRQNAQLQGFTPDDNAVLADLTTARAQEPANMDLAIATLLNLVDLKNSPEQVEFIVREAYRLVGRWMYTDNAIVNFNLTDETRAQLNAIIDQKAEQVSKIVVDQNLLLAVQDITKFNTLKNIRETERKQFQTQLLEAADKLRSFEEQTASIQYLATAKDGEIQDLHLNPMVKTVIDGFHAEGVTYESAYLSYKKLLLMYLSAFDFTQKPASMKLDDLIKVQDSLKWAPEKVSKSIPADQLKALSANVDTRVKDAKDLLRIGEMMKFNVYELTALRPGEAVKVSDLKLAEPMPIIGGIFKSEKTKYLEAIKSDVYLNAPLLGSSLSEEGQAGELWEALADRRGSSEELFGLVDRRLVAVSKQINENLLLTEKLLNQYKSTNDDSLNAAGEELRTLVLRASQIGVALNQFAGFSSYYEDIRKELLVPNFWQDQWASLSTWSDNAFLGLLAFYAFRLIGKKITMVGEVTDAISKFLVPIFGPKLIGLNLFLFGTFIGGISQKAADGWFFESARKDLLEKFFHCGSAAPCVGLYQDVNAQAELVDQNRNEVYRQVGAMLLMVGGMAAFSAVSKLIRATVKTIRGNFITAQIKNLGADSALKAGQAPSAALSAETNKANMIARIAEGKTKYADPLVRDLYEISVRDSYVQLEKMAFEQSLKWKSMDRRFAKDLKVMGMKAFEWKDPANIYNKQVELINAVKTGRISNNQYRRLMNVLQEMTEILQPVYAEMAASPGYSLFMGRVWGAAKLTIPEIHGELDALRGRIPGLYKKFAQNHLVRLGTQNGRAVNVAQQPLRLNRKAEKAIRDLITQIENNPELQTVSSIDLENLVRLAVRK